jgi:putative methyltransferase (TIGR04325 family)
MNTSRMPPTPSSWRRLRQRLVRLARRLVPSRLPMKGPYPSYAAARADATGYDSSAIAGQVEGTVRALARGEIGYERDGTGYPTRPPELVLRHVLAAHLNADDVVVDFGGGLGGTFLNHADLFPAETRKIVVEQACFVERGQSLARDLGLDIHFLTGLGSIPKADVIIASGVLQYLEDYTDVLSLMTGLQPRLIILDRTAFASREQWYIQECQGYGDGVARIPIRPIQIEKLKASLSEYHPCQTWTNPFDPDWPIHQGLLLKRKL